MATEDIEGADYAVVFKDVGTGWLDCHPTASLNTEEAVEALQVLVGSEEVKISLHRCGLGGQYRR